VHDIRELENFIVAWRRRCWCLRTIGRTGFARIRILGNDPPNGSKDLFHCWFLLCRGRSHRSNDL
jgi:hypothetical protein